MHCYKDEKCDHFDGPMLVGMGGPDMLEEILKVFLSWAKSHTDTSFWDEAVEEFESKCRAYVDQKDKVSYLREILSTLDDIPTEHPRKKEAIELFNKCWNEILHLIKD